MSDLFCGFPKVKFGINILSIMFPRLFRAGRNVGFQRKLSGEVETKLERVEVRLDGLKDLSNSTIIIGVLVSLGLYGFCNENKRTISQLMVDRTSLKSEIKQLNAKVEKLEKGRKVSDQ